MLAWVVMLCVSSAGDAHDNPTAGEFFEKRIRPVLIEHCYKCHSSQSNPPKSGLRVDSRASLLMGGERGPAIVAGEPARSRLIEAIHHSNVDLKMPPRGKLSGSIVADFEKWVSMGAPWPGTDRAVELPKKGPIDLSKRKKEHWAWQPLQRHEPPVTRDSRWSRTDLDRFVLARLETAGLTPARQAEPHTLLRRLYFDLIGLPPTPDEVAAFATDAAKDRDSAIVRVVDRLLASPQFGERWARHWLDLVRYADSRGHEFDPTIPNAWQYRDYVIRSLNTDVPYDQWVTEHVAGDLIPKPRISANEINESILGTGFWFLGEEVHSPVDIRGDQADRFDNRIDVFSKTFLGLTLSCARCHDHKFDAISTRDYYAMFGFLESSGYRQVRFDVHSSNRRIASELQSRRNEASRTLGRAVAKAAKPATTDLAAYLEAARDVVRPIVPGNAANRRLDPAKVNGWAEAIREAARDPLNPLHLWAKACFDAKPVAQMLESVRRPKAAIPPGTIVVVDYSNLRSNDWMTDDVGFGPGPARVGELRFDDRLPAPGIGVVDRTAAVADVFWKVQRLAANTEMDHGNLGKTMIPGRILRTPSFKLERQRLFYLVNGHGSAYAAVSHHAIINGPLHGSLITTFNTHGRWQWVSHDLGPYCGLRSFVEFSSQNDADLSVALVVQADRSPELEFPPAPPVFDWLAGTIATPEALARAYQSAFVELVDRLGQDNFVGSLDAAKFAPLASWLLGHADLFDAKGALSDAAKPLQESQRSLAQQVKPTARLAPAMFDGNGIDETVFIRGSHRLSGDVVPRRFLEALAGQSAINASHGSGRFQLAGQLTDPAVNPLLPRVMVNRVWYHLFGRGIVASTDNLGVMGEAPTHPELLDYLATTFVADRWSVKRLIRSMVLSASYQMSVTPNAFADPTKDPQNQLLSHARIRRLEGEAIRDAMLSVAGKLDPTMYGPPIPIHLTEFLDGRGRPQSGPLDGQGRRSLYLAVRRNFLSPMMTAFDTPSPFSTVGRRTVSNVPAQALILLNDPFVHQQAQRWAEREVAQPGDQQDRVNRMFVRAFSRSATPDEREACLTFVKSQAQLYAVGIDDVAPWADLAHTLFNAKEFVFRN
jgi:hypothetical protein